MSNKELFIHLVALQRAKRANLPLLVESIKNKIYANK
jgi:hypothetical protein